MPSQQRLPSLHVVGSQSGAMPVPRADVIREPRAEMIREPIPCMPPLSIAQRLDGHALGFSETRGHNVPALRLETGYLPHCNTSFAVPGPAQDSGSSDLANPYEERADEIGPAHGIPGVGHLGDLLTPPGWVRGMGPFNTKQVKQLYETARKIARETLTADTARLEGLGPQERASKERPRTAKWETELRLDKLLLEERLAIYSAHKANSSKVVSGYAVAQGSGVLATLDPPAQTSIPYQHDTLRPGMSALFQPNYGPMRPSHHPAQGKMISRQSRPLLMPVLV